MHRRGPLRILLVGALSWNPERIRSLAEQGHELLGLWSRSMAWDQGPYPVLDRWVKTVTVDDLAETLARDPIDCVYALFQVYGPALWGPPTPGVAEDVWSLLRRVFAERERGTFDAPIIFHWGFDVHLVDPGVVKALDAQIFCNEEQLRHWTGAVDQGGRALDIFSSAVVGFLDSDRPSARFMNDDFAEPLSNATGEIHTVCIGRPFNIDYRAAADNGIHVHVYGNNYDDVEAMLVQHLGAGGLRRDLGKILPFLHLHPTRQVIGQPWDVVEHEKSRWVREFSRYDAGWSYIGTPFPWTALEDRSAIPNRLSTYLLAGLPVITDRRPGFYRYDELDRLGVNIDLVGTDYSALRGRLDAEVASRARRARARAARHDYAFEATIDPLLEIIERARSAYFDTPDSDRRRVPTGTEQAVVALGGPAHARRRSRAVADAAPLGPRDRHRALASTLRRKLRTLRGRVTRWAAMETGRRRLRSAHVPGADEDVGHRVVVLERFADPSRRCDLERVLADGADQQAAVWDLAPPAGRQSPGPVELTRAGIEWLLLPMSPRARWRIILAVRDMRGPRRHALVVLPTMLRRLRAHAPDEIVCYSTIGFPLAAVLADISEANLREMLATGTQYFGEFAFEMFAVIPYAHWLHEQGRLEYTVSTADTRSLYYFSPNHIERDVARRWVPVTEYPAARVGNRVHVEELDGMPRVLDRARWSPPRYGEVFRDERFEWEKPPVVICNKASDERYLGDGFAVNYLDNDLLVSVVDLLTDEHTVIYDRPRASDIVTDHADHREPGDIDALLAAHPEVVTIQALAKRHPELTFNELQLRVFASCSRFVSVLGGGSYLASYFGGVNIVYAKRGLEVDLDAFDNWFHHLSGARVVPVKSADDLLEAVAREFG
jgi:hypothetical protein